MPADLPEVGFRCSPDHLCGLLDGVATNLQHWIKAIRARGGVVEHADIDCLAAELRVDAGVLLSLVEAESQSR